MLSKYNILLASNSPRRKELLSGLDLEYQVVTIEDIDESYPDSIKGIDITNYLAQKKSKAYTIGRNDLLITADTIVLLNDLILGKPKNLDEARKMLSLLSGHSHTVATGVCIRSQKKTVTFTVTSEVRFAQITQKEIDYYVNKYLPLDKAGAYGIQEWIGYIAVEHISGSYFNIMGLPAQRLYQELKNFTL